MSAAERLEHRGTGRDWEKLVAALNRLVEGSGRRLIRAACERGLQRLGEQLLAIITEEREALQRPIEESEQRIALMKQTIAEAERSMRELGVSFHGRAAASLGHVCRSAQSISGGGCCRKPTRNSTMLLRSISGGWVHPIAGESSMRHRRSHVVTWCRG